MHKYINTKNDIEKLILNTMKYLFLIFNTVNYIFPILEIFPNTNIFKFLAMMCSILWIGYDYLFCKYLWKKNRYLSLKLHTPNLSGIWKMEGFSYNIEKDKDFLFEGEIEIIQEFNRISINLKTKNSSSKSITAVLSEVPNGDYDLIYTYLNSPKDTKKENRDMKMHYGCCKITFDKNLKTAECKYFNDGRERTSYGTMKLTKKEEVV